jgi:predicted dehydrogenase
MNFFIEQKHEKKMDRKVKIALIGPGRMGRNYALSVIQNSNAELIAICGNTKATTKKNSEGINVPLYFHNEWNKMFDENPQIDTVIISTSEWAHLNPFLDAVKYKKNIILEKPVAILKNDYDLMSNQINQEKKLKYLVCFTCRFDLRYVKAEQMVSEGKVGTVNYIYSRRNADLQSFSRIKGKVPLPFWIAVHDIDLLRWFFKSEVKSVLAVQPGSDVDSDILIANLFFENGKLGTIETVSIGNRVSGNQHSRMDIHGSTGKIELNLSSSGIRRFSDDQSLTEEDVSDFVNLHGQYVGNTPSMINHFIEVLLKADKKPVVDMNDGIIAVKISNALCQSLITGQRVNL